ncbi:MAG: hypothetical protein V7629_05555 [Motiliproteus sp.]
MVVFKILSKVSGQHYVGSCRGNIDERWELYLRAAEAGLDFPLYVEIREHGEAQFLIEELDYADDIAELKEMELLHTIELVARSLRNYKFGRTDAVVKRIRQVDHERAWMKDLPEEPVRAKFSSTPALKVKSKPSPKPKPMPAVPRPSIAAPASTSTVRVADGASRPAGVGKAPSIVESRPENSSAELDKALFAEGIGLLVRAVATVEQLSQRQQQARDGAKALALALAESERTLQQLQVQQDEAALRARLAMEAVAASQSANIVLMDAQRQARESSLAALAVLESGDEASIQAAQLQQELSRLLLRIKVGATTSKSVSALPQLESQRAVEKPVSAPAVEMPVVPLSVSQSMPPLPIVSASLSSAPVAPSFNNVQRCQEAEEAKMVNQLKQLGQMLTQPQPQQVGVADVESVPGAIEAELSGRPLEVRSPARAWIGTTADDAESALVLVNKSTPTTVVHRRSKAPRSVLASATGAGRKTLSIKAR